MEEGQAGRRCLSCMLPCYHEAWLWIVGRTGYEYRYLAFGPF